MDNCNLFDCKKKEILTKDKPIKLWNHQGEKIKPSKEVVESWKEEQDPPDDDSEPKKKISLGKGGISHNN